MIREYDCYPQGIVDTFLRENQIVEENFQKNPYSRLLTYEKDHTVIGYLLYSEIFERIEIDQIQVKEEYQRQGIASSLMEYLIQKTKDKENITLEVRKDNQKAISLYLKYGFEKKAIRKGYYQGIDGILMEKKMKL